MQKLFLLLSISLLLSTSALADTVTISTSPTAANGGNQNTSSSGYQGGSQQVDLDHHSAYTWRIGDLSLPQGQTIVSASITFRNISNWDTNTNILFVHLLDTADDSGWRSFLDAPSNQRPVTTIHDDFDGAWLDSNPLVDDDTGNALLFSRGFNMVGQSGYTAQDYTWTFTADQLATLATFIANGGNIAFGIDPDCHFWNNGIVFTFTTAAVTGVPEPASMLLLGGGLASLSSLYLRRRRRQQN